MKSINQLVCTILLLVVATTAMAQKLDPDPGRFAKEISKIVAWDSKNSFPENAFLFVGSSSIRLWPTAQSFPELPIINRGFGGSEM